MRLIKCTRSNNKHGVEAEEELYSYMLIQADNKINDYDEEYIAFILETAEEMGLKDLVKDFKNKNYKSEHLGFIYDVQCYIRSRMSDLDKETILKYEAFALFLDDNSIYEYLVTHYPSIFSIVVVPSYNTIYDFDLSDDLNTLKH